jgi:hypothetical protein
MVITYYGASCVKVQSGETVLVFNPPSKDSAFKSPRFQSNLILVSKNEKDFNGVDNMGSKDESKPVLAINGPGEYEAGGIHIKGILNSDNTNTIYTLSLEDIKICHLGDFREENLSPEPKEEIGEVDVLFVPVQQDDGEKAGKLITKLEPKIAIPVYFKEGDLKKFLKEMGESGTKAEDKLTIKKKELSEEKTRVVVLSPVL